MEQNANQPAPEAPTDERASSCNPERKKNTPEEPAFNVPLLSDCLAETFPPGGRKPRHDGWTPAAIAGFLEHLAASGIVEHAAEAAGLSASSAYAFRNRRQGRAFAKMWDAILVNRTRARVAGEVQSRAIAGCVSVRKKDGMVVGEYHYYDNRLAMSVLARLDRLAEKEAASEAHLRALSEDLDDYLDCVAQGGDVDAFVEARRPPPEAPAPASAAAPSPPSEPQLAEDQELDALARLTGCPTYRDVPSHQIPVLDLDISAKQEWEADQWIRAFRSGFLMWLHIRGEPDDVAGRGAAYAFEFLRRAAAAAAAGAAPGEAAEEEPDPSRIFDWTDGELASGWRSGLLGALPNEYWDDLADLAGGDVRDPEEE